MKFYIVGNAASGILPDYSRRKLRDPEGAPQVAKLLALSKGSLAPVGAAMSSSKMSSFLSQRGPCLSNFFMPIVWLSNDGHEFGSSQRSTPSQLPFAG